MNNIDRHKQAFQEEAREILSELEGSLLELNEHPEDEELVGRIFRAMHTIKGSGAMFGFDQLAAFTHHLENAFDEVRHGRLKVTPELVDLSLVARDQIKMMVDEPQDESEERKASAQSVLAKLQELTGSANADVPAPASVGPAAANLRDSEGSTRVWRIHFAPGPDLLRNGTNPLLLLRELSQLGNLHVNANTDSIPALRELDSTSCYVSWELTLTTEASQDAIRDVFIFVEDSCELKIEEITPAAVNVAEELKELSEKRSSTGRRAYDKPDSASSIRVPATKLDEFVNLVGELVTVQARLSALAASSDDPDVAAVSEEIERLTGALRENSMSVRMLPIRGTFERFRRLVHDLARDLHKDVELTVEGADTELDKTVIDQLNDPLMHLIRNSMDHGIEPPETRMAAGKQSTATLHLSARHSGANVLITVSDDGRGIDAAAVRKRAIENGLVSPDAQLSDNEIYSLILLPGFSTAREVTDVSGRGVGMDVVHQRVEALRGTIEISSKPGCGTNITLRLPLTMAIIDGLLVRVERAHYVLPLANTLECIELTRQDIEKANGKQVANVRDELVPYIRLREFFGIATERPEREQIMVTETEEGRFGLVVDEVLGDHQTVIKNLGKFYRQVQFVSGATILGNGSVALIIDPHRLVQEAIRTADSCSRLRAQAESGKGSCEGWAPNSS